MNTIRSQPMETNSIIIVLALWMGHKATIDSIVTSW